MFTTIRQHWKACVLGWVSLGLALLLTLTLEPLRAQRPYLVFFPAIMVCAWWGGLPLALPAIGLSAVAVHVWVVAPHRPWTVTSTEAFQMGAFLAVAAGMSWGLSALVAARTRFAVTLASIGDAVIVTDRRGRVTFLNDVAADLTGWTMPEAAGRDLTAVFSIMNMYTRQAVESPVTRVLREGHVVGLANHTILRARDGTERPIDDSGAPIRTPAGDLVGVVLVFRDVTERRRSEEARRRLAAIVESSEDAIIGKTLDGLITDWNQGAERLYGYTAAEMVGQSIARLIPPDLPDDLPAILTRLRQGERIAHYETQRVAKDGTRLDVALTISPIRDEAGQLIGASKIARDITARKRAEAELERRRQETALLAEIAHSLSVSLDLDTVLQRVVAGVQTLCGSERAFLALRDPGTDVLTGRYEVGAPRAGYVGLRLPPGQGLAAQVLRTGRAWRTADYRDDTRFRPVSVAGVRAGGHLAVVAVPIQIGGHVAGVLYASNPTTQPFTDRDEAILVRLAAHAAIAIQNAQLYQQAQAELAERQRAEAALAQAAAELEQRVEERTAALQRAMVERQRLERDAQRAEHFALLGRLAAGVSHEIRNPLGAMSLHIDVLSEELQHPSPDSAAAIDEALSEIKQQLRRLEDLVEDHLSLVRVASLERTPQDLGPLLHGWARDWASMAATRGVTFRCEGLETVGVVALHPATLRRAVLNLVQNALEAMPAGGTLTVRGRQQDAIVQLEVQDTGSGIPPETQARMFEPLFTTKPGGTGLGLYIVQEVVAAHGGTLTVASQVGQGTTFTMRFQLMESQEATEDERG